MVIDFQNLNTDKNTSLPYIKYVYAINGNYNIEIKNFRAGKNLGNREFRNLIMAHSKGNSIKLTNVDLSRCIAPAELFRHVEINELRLDNVKFCDGADFKSYFNNSKILKHNLCDFNLTGASQISR